MLHMLGDWRAGCAVNDYEDGWSLAFTWGYHLPVVAACLTEAVVSEIRAAYLRDKSWNGLYRIYFIQDT